MFTRHLAPRVANVTAVDASPEVIACNRARVARDDVHYVLADLFEWKPHERYDLLVDDLTRNHDWETRRIREDLGWEGRLVLLLEMPGKNSSEFARWFTPAGLQEAAGFVDGVGPPLAAIATGASKANRKLTDFVNHAHASKLVVHPWTLRADDFNIHAIDPHFNSGGH